MKWLASILRAIADSIDPKQTLELPSPKIRIRWEQTDVLPNGIIQIKGLDPDVIRVLIAPSNSMEPAIDDGMIVFVEPVRDVSDLQAGDILVFEVGTLIIHRIIEVGSDWAGWYCRTKGDNNSQPDPFVVRTNNIRWLYRGQIT